MTENKLQKACDKYLDILVNQGRCIYSGIPDSRKIRAELENIKRAVVMGAGYLGLELAENLKKRDVQVTVLQANDQVMASLDQEMATYVADHLAKHEIDLRLNSKTTAIQQNVDSSLQVILASGDQLTVDAVISACPP